MNTPRLLSVVTLISAFSVPYAESQEPRQDSRARSAEAPAPARGTPDASRGERSSTPPGERGTAPAPSASRLQMMRDRLGLSEEQASRLEPIFADEDANIQKLRSDTSLSDEQRRTQVDEIRGSTRDKVAAVLTQEQKIKLADEAVRQREARAAGEARAGGEARAAGERRAGAEARGAGEKRGGGADPEKLISEIKEKLGLNDEQTAKLRSILNEAGSRVSSPRPERQPGAEGRGAGAPAGGERRERAREGAAAPAR